MFFEEPPGVSPPPSPMGKPGVGTSADAAGKSVPITADRATILMNIKDLPAAASFTFEGACATMDSTLCPRPSQKLSGIGRKRLPHENVNPFASQTLRFEIFSHR